MLNAGIYDINERPGFMWDYVSGDAGISRVCTAVKIGLRIPFRYGGEGILVYFDGTISSGYGT
ncbi:hypothetical protein DWV84_20120 [Blautia sp. AF13-16]|nr:hypothetical protein C3R19_06275 [Blautia producta]RHP77388.1 hypothetical protein DXA40_22020 [Blautia sp. OF01-4LB]RHS12451.1 hypothetical protein DWV84_20120 [Blautia sp. AF13-16]